MARKKVTLAWIPNAKKRGGTFTKRRKGLMKKVSELATLCDLKACAIVYGPDDPKPEVWPSAPEAMQVLAQFQSEPDLERCKKMMDQEGFLRQQIDKLQEQLRRQQHKNREMENIVLMHDALAGTGTGRGVGLHYTGIAETASLKWMVDMKLNEVRQRIDALMAAEKEQQMAADKEQMQNNWFLDVMNPNENVYFGAEEMFQPCGYVDHGGAWIVDNDMMRLNTVQQRMDMDSGAAAQDAIKIEETIKPEGSNGVVTKEKNPMEVAMEALQRQNWFTDVVNPNENAFFADEEEMVQPYRFVDHDPGSAWLDTS